MRVMLCTLWLKHDLARRLTKCYTVYKSQEDSIRPIHDPPTTYSGKLPDSFFFKFGFMASGGSARGALSRAINAAFGGVTILCDLQLLIESCDRDKHAPIYVYSNSNPSSLSIIYGVW